MEGKRNGNKQMIAYCEKILDPKEYTNECGEKIISYEYPYVRFDYFMPTGYIQAVIFNTDNIIQMRAAVVAETIFSTN